MIDNIKFSILDKNLFERNLEAKNLISLKSTYNVITGEANEYPKTGKCHNLEIRVTSLSATIKGSIHKYFNIINGEGNQNYNDFSYSQFVFAINHLCESLQINKEKTKITNLEFGFNIETKQSPKSIIDKQLLMYNYLDHNRNHNYRGKGSYKEFEKTDYSIKVYDKSKQYKISHKNILRIELKMINSRYIQRMGVFNLNQLGKGAFKTFFNAFLSHFNKLMIVDSLDAPQGIRTDQIVLFQGCTSPNYWKKLSAKQKIEPKKEFKKIIEKNNHNKTHALLRNRIIRKYKLLINENS